MKSSHITSQTLPASDLATLRLPEATYVLRGLDPDGQEHFYTGKAGEGYVSKNINDAFPYQTIEGARRKAGVLNSTSSWMRFVAVGLNPPGVTLDDYDPAEDDYRGADAD